MSKSITTNLEVETPRHCEHCGGKFFPTKNSKGRFCSVECMGNSRKEKKVEVSCKTCGKKFFVKPHVVKEGNGKYCSRECCFQAQRARGGKHGS